MTARVHRLTLCVRVQRAKLSSEQLMKETEGSVEHMREAGDRFTARA